MKKLALMLLASVLLSSSGCGGGSPQKRTVPAELEYAMDTRAAVLEFQSTAKKNMRQARRDIARLVENLESYEKEPLGEHKAIYDGIVSGLKEVESMLSSRTDSRKVMEKIDAVAKLAKSLPDS